MAPIMRLSTLICIIFIVIIVATNCESKKKQPKKPPKKECVEIKDSDNKKYAEEVRSKCMFDAGFKSQQVSEKCKLRASTGIVECDVEIDRKVFAKNFIKCVRDWYCDQIDKISIGWLAPLYITRIFTPGYKPELPFDFSKDTDKDNHRPYVGECNNHKFVKNPKKLDLEYESCVGQGFTDKNKKKIEEYKKTNGPLPAGAKQPYCRNTNKPPSPCPEFK